MSAAPKLTPKPDVRISRPGIADDWHRNATELASWTNVHLVNRRDVFGHYIALERRKAGKSTAFTDKTGLTIEILERHYRGEDQGDVIGLHSTAQDEGPGESEVPACWSRWGAIDIDRHGDHEDPEANLRAALAWHRRAAGLGFHPLLTDSNGDGGYHLRVIFDAPTPTADVFRFMEWLRRDWKEVGLAERPETFPKQTQLGKGKVFGNWLRLPGRHHTRDHWSRVWNGLEWIEGNAAIGFILAITGDPASLIPAGEQPEEPAAAESRGASSRTTAAAGLRSDEDQAREALGYLGHMVDDYDSWLEIGMALTPLGNAGLVLWEEWSRRGSKFEDGACVRKWASFTREGRTLGTIFKHAKSAGWTGSGGRNGHAANGHHAEAELATSPDQTPEPWEDPKLGTTPPAIPFPVDVFPPQLAALVIEQAAALNAPVDYLAVSAIVTASTVIGRSVALEIRATWRETPAIYCAAVGLSGMAKSPSIMKMTGPLWKIATEAREQWRTCKERETKKKEEDREDVPPLKRTVVDESTVEALGPILQENPRGVGMVRDELTALVCGMNQYKGGGKGSDRQFFLSAWSGSPWSIDRKNNPDGMPILVPHPFLSIIGGLVNSKLTALSDAKDRDDGFIERLLFTVPEPVRVRWYHGEVNGELVEDWEQAVRRLWDVPMVADAGSCRPRFVRFQPPAMDVFIAWYDAHSEETEGLDFPAYLAGNWAKMRAYCGRLALIIDRLAWAYDPTEGDMAKDVSVASVRAAIRLVDYFKGHARRAHALIRGSGSEDNEDARAILKWAVGTGKSQFSERDVKNVLYARFGGGQSLDLAIAWLIGRRCIRRLPTPTASPKVGRKRTPAYEVNPALLVSAD